MSHQGIIVSSILILLILKQNQLGWSVPYQNKTVYYQFHFAVGILFVLGCAAEEPMVMETAVFSSRLGFMQIVTYMVNFVVSIVHT